MNLFLIMFLFDVRLKQMCDKVVLENCEMLMFIPDRYNDQCMCNKAVDNYAHALGSVHNSFKTQKCVIKMSVLFLL